MNLDIVRQPRKGQRRYGVLLDGGALTMVCLEGEQIVESDHLSRPTAVEALSAWLAERKPKGPVTVSLVAPSEETAEVALSDGLASDAMREVIRERVAGHFPKDAGPFAVVARLRHQDGGLLARVAAIPQRMIEGLWRVAKPNVRFTLPAMTYTTDGLHLAVCETSADLYLVTQGQVREAVALACGGRKSASEGEEPDLSEYADRVAEEVVQARNSWLRRRLDVAYDKVAVAGSAVPRAELTDAFRHRGIEVSADRITESLPDAAALPDGETGLLGLALALAAAVVDAGPIGYLDDVARRRRRVATAPGEPVVIDTRLKRALPMVVGAGILAVAAAAIVPSLDGNSALSTAQTEHAAAVAQQAHYSGDIALYQYTQQLQVAVAAHQGLAWGKIVPAVVATVPQGITLSTLSLKAQGTMVKVTAQATAAQTSLVPKWLAILQRQHLDPSVAGVTTGSGSSSSGGSSGASSSTTSPTSASSSPGASSSSSAASGTASFTATFVVPGSYH